VRTSPRVWLLGAALLFAVPAHAEEATVQSLLLRAVTVTCKLDETIAFYRDVLGQRVLEESVRDGARVSAYVDLPKTTDVRLVVMGGSGAYPGGDVMGGKLAFIGIADKKAKACKEADKASKSDRAKAGDVVFSLRVANLDEIAARAAKLKTPVLVPPGRSGSGLARNMMLVDPNGRMIEALEIHFAKPSE